jgi:hypothetical protein
MTLLTNWEHTNVQWFDNYVQMWEEQELRNPVVEAAQVGQQLNDKLGLPMCRLDIEQSKFFKRHYNADKKNRGPLITEMEVIREIEGW